MSRIELMVNKFIENSGEVNKNLLVEVICEGARQTICNGPFLILENHLQTSEAISKVGSWQEITPLLAVCSL